MNGKNNMGSKGFMNLNECFEWDTSKVVIIPFGLEDSVSFGAGTRYGPKALISASHEVELYDEDMQCEPYKIGICTLKEPVIPKNHEAAMKQLQEMVAQALDAGKLPIILGGEHSITEGPVRAATNKHKDIVLLHFDAHSDLRTEFDGTPHSHACAMHLCLPHVSHIVSIGIRNVSAEELPIIQKNKDKVSIFYARKDVEKRGISSVIKDVLPLIKRKKVYMSFDVDALDPAVIGSSTGTPEPGGMAYYDVVECFEKLVPECDVIAADFVEHAPVKGQHAPDFTIARLIYKFIGYCQKGKS